MKVEIESYEEFSHRSFNRMVEQIFQSTVEGYERIKKYKIDVKYCNLIDKLKLYAELGKKTALIGNKKKAYRIYIRLAYLLKGIA